MEASSQFQRSALAMLLWLAAGLAAQALAAPTATSSSDTRHRLGRQLCSGRVRQRRQARRQPSYRICQHRAEGGRQRGGL